MRWLIVKKKMIMCKLCASKKHIVSSWRGLEEH